MPDDPDARRSQNHAGHLANSAWIRRQPQVGFSRTNRRMIATVTAGMLGLPGRWVESICGEPGPGVSGEGSRVPRRTVPSADDLAAAPARRAAPDREYEEPVGRPGGTARQPRGEA